MRLALLYSVFGVAIEKARGAEDDLNTIVAGTMTGVLYKSPGRPFHGYISIFFYILLYIL